MAQTDPTSLGVTALYTSQAWIRGGLAEAWLFDTRAGRAVYWATTGIYELARWLRPAMTPIQVGLLHRHLMFDHLLEAQDPPQVVELAAGLSARGARFSVGGRRYTEVDLAPVLEAKTRLLSRTAHGREVARRPNLRRVPADVRHLDLAPLLTAEGPAVVLAEGLHMYLEVAAQRRLWRVVADGLRRGPGGTFLFDHFRPAAARPPGPVSRTVAHTLKRWRENIGFRPDRRSHHDLQRDLLDAGFAHVETYRSRDVARPWGLLQPGVLTDAVLYAAHVQGPQP